MEREKQITDGELKLDPGTDAMTLVFGKENRGFLRGVGTGVTPTRYFHVPPNRGSTKQQMKELQLELQKERRAKQEKDEELKALSVKVPEQEITISQILASLASQGKVLPNITSSTNGSPTQVSEFVCNNNVL
jgi:vacuolar-type H+-ATPase subunit I/STV1